MVYGSNQFHVMAILGNRSHVMFSLRNWYKKNAKAGYLWPSARKYCLGKKSRDDTRYWAIFIRVGIRNLVVDRTFWLVLALFAFSKLQLLVKSSLKYLLCRCLLLGLIVELVALTKNGYVVLWRSMRSCYFGRTARQRNHSIRPFLWTFRLVFRSSVC